MKFKQMVLTRLMMVLLPLGAGAQGIHIGTGAKFMVTGAASLVINNGGLVNDGSFSAGDGTVVFTGTAAAGVTGIGGAAALAFRNVTINKTAGEVQLNRDVSISDKITMTSGNLQLNRHTLDLLTTGSIIGEGNQSYMTGINAGRIVRKATLSPPTFINPGNIGLALLPDAAGVYIIVRMHTVENLPGGGKSVLRNFSISYPAVVPASLNYFFYFLDGELNGNEPQSLVPYGSDRAGLPLTVLNGASYGSFGNMVYDYSAPAVGHITAGARAIVPGKSAQVSKSSAGTVGLSGIRAYPNPAHDVVTLDVNSLTEGPVAIDLYDQSGRLREQKVVQCAAGKNSIVWDISKYGTGIYYASFAGKSIKIVKE
jgi:hypothetical protein